MEQPHIASRRDAALAHVYDLTRLAASDEGARRIAREKLTRLGGDQAIRDAESIFSAGSPAPRLETIEQARSDLSAGKTNLSRLPESAEKYYLQACAALAQDKTTAGVREASALLLKAIELDGKSTAYQTLLAALSEATGAAQGRLRGDGFPTLDPLPSEVFTPIVDERANEPLGTLNTHRARRGGGFLRTIIILSLLASIVYFVLRCL